MLIRAGRGHPQTGFLRLLEIGQVERSVEPSWWRGQDLNLRPSGYETYFDGLTCYA